MENLPSAVLTLGFICLAAGILLLVLPKQHGSVFEKTATSMVFGGAACVMLGIAGLVIVSGLGAANWIGVATLLGVGVVLLSKALSLIWRGVVGNRHTPAQ